MGQGESLNRVAAISSWRKTEMKRAVRIDERDNVAVALVRLEPGERIALGGLEVVLGEEILPGHKVALFDLPAGSRAIKYGHPIGCLTAGVRAGDWVHTHNLRSELAGPRAYTYRPGRVEVEPSPGPPPTFRGYRRRGGKAGIRNEIWVLAAVGCINKQCERLARLAGERLAGVPDGIHVFGHPYGCSQLGEDLERTRRILAGLAAHPNAGGVLVVGLGCEENRLADLEAALGDYDRERVKFLLLQEAEDETAEALHLLEVLIREAKEDRREEISAAELVVGLKCGGSDGFSGLTANPLVGLVVDRIVGWGGSCLLGEIPEIFGAEEVLLARARDEETFHHLAALVNEWKDYYLGHGVPVYENPSPGNLAGGITTLEEKSLGCVEKAGRAPVADVLRYGEGIRRRGLSLVESPGNDPVATTALAAAGAHLVLFTTGRGTPYGGPVPTLKIASRSELARAKPNWIDFDAGRLLAGEDLGSLADELAALLLTVAGGEVVTRNEINGDREMAIFKTGVTL